ncbi:MAG: DMT family transporter [Pseudomonadota bacterium]
MSVPAAYLGVILIWSSTPLAIKWSGQEVGFLFGVTARMTLGALVGLAILLALRQPLPLDRAAMRVYAAAAVNLFGGLLCVYWAAQYIPSGIISVIYGLMPLITCVMAVVWLKETLSWNKLCGLLLGLAGLIGVFSSDLSAGSGAYGLAAVVLAVVLQSYSGIAVKKLATDLAPLAVTVGGVLFSLPGYVLLWLLFGGPWPQAIPEYVLGSIVYLGIFGSVLGFFLYFYVLRHGSAVTAALITLVTPVTALMLGNLLDGEPITAQTLLGAGMILFGLAVYHWGGMVFGARRADRS